MDIGNPNSSQVIVDNLGDVLKIVDITQANLEVTTKTAGCIHFRKEVDGRYLLPGVIKEYNGKNIKWKVITIPAWNMDSDDAINLTHGLGTKYMNVISAYISIRNDAGNTIYTNSYNGFSSSTFELHVGGFHSINVEVNRFQGGLFDSATFTSTAFDRGYLTIMYFE